MGRPFHWLLVIPVMILCACLLMAVVSADTMMEEDCTNRPGSDYDTKYFNTKQECSNACRADPQCQAAHVRVHIPGQQPSCWMKNAVPAAVLFAPCDMQAA